MTSSLTDHLTAQFYEWEIRGRGWYVFTDAAVTPEPPFIPFVRDYVPKARDIIDDGREHTLGSRLLDQLVALFRPSNRAPESAPLPQGTENVTVEEREALVNLSVVLPKDVTYPREVTEQFLLNLSACHHPICVEWVGTKEAVTMQLVVEVCDEAHVTSLLQNHFPDAVVTRGHDLLIQHWDVNADTLVVEWGLSDEFMLPLRNYRSFTPDPLIGVLSALGSLHDQELACLQILFEPATSPWITNTLHAVTAPDGQPFFTNAPEITRAASEKLSSPLYGVVIRGIGQSPLPGRDRKILRNLAGALRMADQPQGNALIPLENNLYDAQTHLIDAINRQSHRSGMLLSLNELMTFVHLPGASVTMPALVRSITQSKAAPESAQQGELVLGLNTHAGKTVTTYQSSEQRLRHTYVIGASGSGKSTLLLSMIKQDIQAGRGVGVLDPHGDLIDHILAHVPDERIQDVILLDLSDEEHPIPFNILSAHSELEKTLLASDLAAVFQRLATSWGDQMTAVLSNGILAFLESSRGGTLSELRRFLVERPYREQFLATVQDPQVVYYWRHEFPLLSGKPQGSVVTRLNTFLRPKPIRHMVAHGENRINVTRIMDSGHILLARIPQGAIGEENAYLLGTLLVSAFHRAALCRQHVEASHRRPYFLYVDEFHHFITPSMASILSGARKYGLGLILAHQEYQQLESREPNVASAVLSNAATRICFRLGDQDARRMVSGLSGFEIADLQNLGTGQAICRIEKAEHAFNLHVPWPDPVDEAATTRKAQAIRTYSRQQYAVARSEVEARLAADYTVPPPRTPQVTSQPLVPPVPPRPPEPAVPAVAADPIQPANPAVISVQHTPGRGGPKHKSIQRLIKHWAEGMGFGAQIEMPILDGRGAVDVVLRKGDLSIACEISVTTPTDYECANIAKCLTAGFTHVVMISDDDDRLKKIQQTLAKSLDAQQCSRIHFLSPQQLFDFIEAHEQSAQSSDNIRGYRVTVKRADLNLNQRSVRLNSIKRTIANAALRQKDRNKHHDTKTGHS